MVAAPAPSNNESALAAALTKAITGTTLDRRTIPSEERRAKTEKADDGNAGKVRKRTTMEQTPTKTEERPAKPTAGAGGPTVKIISGASTLEFTHGSERERETLLKFAKEQQSLNHAANIVGMIGQAAGAILAIVGSVAMTWAIVQGVKANTRA